MQCCINTNAIALPAHHTQAKPPQDTNSTPTNKELRSYNLTSFFCFWDLLAQRDSVCVITGMEEILLPGETPPVKIPRKASDDRESRRRSNEEGDFQ